MSDLSKHAHEIINHVQNAAGDIYIWEGDLFCYDEPLRSRLAEVVHGNQSEIIKRDCFGDILYDDVGFVLDIAGDRIHDLAHGDNDIMILIALEIQSIEGERSTFGKAMQQFINRHERR